MLLGDALPLSLASVVDGVNGPDVDAALATAADLTALVPQPGSGATLLRWDVLAALAAADLTVARVAEAHLDAVAILAEASATEDVDLVAAVGENDLGRTTWGVYAAEGPGVLLTARRGDDGTFRLDGTKPWCSLANVVSHALVTAHVDDGRQLFAVSLRHPGVQVRMGTWHARGLTDVPSGPVDFADVPAWPVGGPGWYLRRPGFAHGGIGVAACWYGGAVAVAGALRAAAARRDPDQLALWHLGAVDLQLHAARTVLRDAAAHVDAGQARDHDGTVLALRARSVVAAAAEQVLHHAGHALGPAPLTLDDEHARRVADLTVYLRQHHAERDLASLGRELLSEDEQQW